MNKQALGIDDTTNPLDLSDNNKEEKEMTIFKLNATQLDTLHETTPSLNRPKFQELMERYETCLNQILVFIIEIEKMKKTYNLPLPIKEIKETVEKNKKNKKILNRN